MLIKLPETREGGASTSVKLIRYAPRGKRLGRVPRSAVAEVTSYRVAVDEFTDRGVPLCAN